MFNAHIFYHKVEGDIGCNPWELWSSHLIMGKMMGFRYLEKPWLWDPYLNYRDLRES